MSGATESPAPLPQNAVLVRMLENLLAKARAGELTGLLAAATGHDGSIGTTLVIPTQAWLLLGAVEALKLQVGQQLARAQQ